MAPLLVAALGGRAGVSADAMPRALLRRLSRDRPPRRADALASANRRVVVGLPAPSRWHAGARGVASERADGRTIIARGGAPELRGRRSECEVLDRLLEAVRAGESRTLVVLGEPGVGKTALLEYLVAHATGFRLARAVGVQSEMELPFAASHQLLAPMLDRLDHLPAPLRSATRWLRRSG
jgi:hypothetical protein